MRKLFLKYARGAGAPVCTGPRGNALGTELVGRSLPIVLALVLGVTVTTPAFALPGLGGLCKVVIAGLGKLTFRVRSAPAEPLDPTAISEVPVDELERFATTPLGAAVTLVTQNGQTIQGLTVDVGFRQVRVVTEQGDVDVPWRNVAEAYVASTALTPEFAERVQRAAALDRRRRAYLEFQELSEEHWRRVREPFAAELEQFRVSDLSTRNARLAQLAAEVDALVVRLTGHEQYALHFNSKGAASYQYIEAGGILATEGDAILPMHIDFDRVGPFISPPRAITVFYHSGQGLGSYTLGKAPNVATTRAAGHYVMAFDAEGIFASRRGNRFSNGVYPAVEYPRLRANQIGVRYDSDFLLPPVLVMADVPRRVGHGTLSHEEQTLAQLLQLASLFADENVSALLPRRVAAAVPAR